MYASGRYSSEHEKTTVAFPLTAGRNGNVLVYDLRYDLEEVEKSLTACPSDTLRAAASHAKGEQAKSSRSVEHTVSVSSTSNSPESPESKSFYPIVKELCLNKCPAVAPLSVLDKDDGWGKIHLTKEQIKKNLEILLKHPEFAEQMRSDAENRPEFPPAIEPEAAIYEGFLNDPDRIN